MLRFVRSVLSLLILSCSVLYGILFAAQNTQLIAIDLIILQPRPLPVGIWLSLSFAFGVALSLIASSLLIWRFRMQLAMLRRKSDKLRASVSRTTG